MEIQIVKDIKTVGQKFCRRQITHNYCQNKSLLPLGTLLNKKLKTYSNFKIISFFGVYLETIVRFTFKASSNCSFLILFNGEIYLINSTHD